LTTAADSGVDVADAKGVDVRLEDELDEAAEDEDVEDVDVVVEVDEDDEDVVVEVAKACVSCG